ncbi:unnamed protein product [Heterobilharzia americana]|nr:unnamed protein product [Heterobilharzia americana]
MENIHFDYQLRNVDGSESHSAVILPQTGYILPQPSFNIVSPLSSGTSTYAHQPLYPRTVHFPLSYAGYSDPRANEMNLTYSPVQSVFSLNPSSVEVMEKDYQIVTYEELEKLLPEPKPTGRVELGLLPNGCAYAPKTASRENYLLFASKYSYILYFTHHYFSRENLCRDQTFLNMLVDRLILPIEKLIKAPRLAALNTTHEEVEQALLGSKIVCVEDMNAGMRGVRRIDGYPGLSMNPDTSTHMQPDSGISAFDTSQNLTSLMASFSIQPPCFADERIAGNPQPVVVMRSPGSEKLRPDTFMNRPGHGSLEMNKEASQTSALIQNSVSTVPGSQNQLPVPILLPICDTDNSSSGQFEYINAPGYSMSSCRDMTSWALQQSSKQYNAYPRIAQFLVPHSANQLGSVGQYKGQSSALNFHSGTTMTGADNARSGEIRNVTVLSVPRQTHLPNYLIRQTANVTESYSASLPVPRTSNTNQPLNFAVAAALASLGANTSSSVNQQQRAHQPHYFSNELLTNSSNISQIGVNSQRPSNPLLDHFHAVAAMSTVAQHHRLSPVYFPNSINQTNPFNMSPRYHCLCTTPRRNCLYKPHFNGTLFSAYNKMLYIPCKLILISRYIMLEAMNHRR